MTEEKFPAYRTDLTAEDIPYGHSIYRSVLDDKTGYEPRAVDSYTDENGRLVIMIALSPGVYQPYTMVSAGWTPDDAGTALESMIAALTASPGPPAKGSPTGSARAPFGGVQNGGQG